jgi:N-acetyl-alpha-D-muramate 1-phosphate uridylyltransferase
MVKRAMILAAGFGKRINPLTLKKPKPLLKIGNETLLSNTIKFLESFGAELIVINVHYLSEQIIEYIKKNKFNVDIKIIKEEDQILDTGGALLNAIKYFSKEPFITINPDTIWNKDYLKELKSMENFFLKNKKIKSVLLLAKKEKSFDKDFVGDFNLNDNIINKENKKHLEYIYTGLQIIKPEILLNFNKKIFSINEIWNQLIKKNELFGIESKNEFLHVSKLEVYKNILKKLNIE